MVAICHDNKIHIYDLITKKEEAYVKKKQMIYNFFGVNLFFHSIMISNIGQWKKMQNSPQFVYRVIANML